MPRDEVVAYLRRYAKETAAPVQTSTEATSVRAGTDGGFLVDTSRGPYRARHLVLASGAYPKPYLPPAAAGMPGTVRQIHADAYRSPGLLPGGAVLVIGSGQSGGQITEDLLEAGREVHLAISSCPEAPRRYRGRDTVYWIIQLSLRGPEVGVWLPQPPPAGRFACNPLVSGRHGGHDICLRSLARQGVRLHGHFEGTDDGVLVFSDDVPDRLAGIEAAFGARLQPVIDAFISTAGIAAPADDRPGHGRFVPAAEPRLDLAAAGISSIIWATGYRLDFGWLDLPVLDDWGYPRHRRGAVEHPGLYAVGLPWLTAHASPLLAGVGRDAAYIAAQIAGRGTP
ncbi:NAD(P)-binding domain-containing protein [Arthrobacter hankyongi]|uniref:NAD(P)-binding domain-containing protein n=1 Tax=Arthrobacter hankyongi TaxID=2904801 RepID=UPI0027E20197|nr:NAD(P)-binding domain-containing protein [Arthrobacter hankyongi]